MSNTFRQDKYRGINFIVYKKKIKNQIYPKQILLEQCFFRDTPWKTEVIENVHARIPRIYLQYADMFACTGKNQTGNVESRLELLQKWIAAAKQNPANSASLACAFFKRPYCFQLKSGKRKCTPLRLQKQLDGVGHVFRVWNECTDARLWSASFARLL